jgi:hypothetical protein
MPVEIDEVNDFAHAQAVDQIPDGSAQDQGKADDQDIPTWAEILQQV